MFSELVVFKALLLLLHVEPKNYVAIRKMPLGFFAIVNELIINNEYQKETRNKSLFWQK